jgi:hypothetical protein
MIEVWRLVVKIRFAWRVFGARGSVRSSIRTVTAGEIA